MQSITVSGKTRIVPVIGHPVSQTKAPAMFSARAALAGHNVIFVPVDIHPDGLRATLDSFRYLGNLAGLVVTIPYKNAVLDMVDGASNAAQAVNAANVVRVHPDGCWTADIKDGEGFVQGLIDANVDIQDGTVQIFGSGGAGAAVAYALAQAGAAEISLSDIEAGKAEALVARLTTAGLPTKLHAGSDAIQSADIVVNASPVGMYGKGGTPFDTRLLSPQQTVAEMIMEPAETELLAAARERGCKTVPGLATLQGQVDAMMSFLDLAPGDGAQNE